MIIGGIAASLLGAPRYTADLDAVILLSANQIPNLLDAAARQGTEPRINDAITFAQKHRGLLLRHSASSVNIDLSLGFLPLKINVEQFGATLDMPGLWDSISELL